MDRNRCGRWVVVLSMCAAVAAGCGSEAGGSTPTTFTSNATGLIAKVPAGAFALVVLDARQPLWQFLTDGVLLPNRPETKTALHKELKAFVDARFGVDVTKLSAAVLFALPGSPAPAVGILVQGVDGKLKGQPLSTHNSVKLFSLDSSIVFAQVGTTLFAGSEVAVRAALDVAGGKADALDEKNPKLARLARNHNGGAFLSLAAHLAEIDDPELQGMRRMSGIDHVAVRISANGIRAMAVGDAQKMKAAVAMLRSRLDRELATLAELKNRATTEDVPAIAGFGAIVQYHLLRNTVRHLEPELNGNQLTIHLPVKLGEQAGVLVAFMGIGAATAIPAFMKYKRKASSTKQVEANLQRLYSSARSYYLLHKRLPPGAGPTPRLGQCCASGGRCRISAGLWRIAQAWTELGFAVKEPHAYSYSFVPSPNGFTVRANGDVDCDGEYSTFEMTGTFIGGTVPSIVPVYREKPNE